MFHLKFVATVFIGLIFMARTDEINQEMPNGPAQIQETVNEPLPNPETAQVATNVDEQNLATQNSSNPCVNGYDYDPIIKCHKVFVKFGGSDWWDARNACKLDGADLVLPQTLEESNALNSIIKKNNVSKTWIRVEAINSGWTIVDDNSEHQVIYRPDFCGGKCYFQKALAAFWSHCLIFKSVGTKEIIIFNKNCNEEIRSYICQKTIASTLVTE